MIRCFLVVDGLRGKKKKEKKEEEDYYLGVVGYCGGLFVWLGLDPSIVLRPVNPG